MTAQPAQPIDSCTVIIGGGIAGLVAAAELARAGERVVVCEATGRTGGMVASAVVDGVRIDTGAEASATRVPAVLDLIRDFDVPLEIAFPNPVGASLISRRFGRIVRSRLPANTLIGMPAQPFATDVRNFIGLWGSVRAALEPLIPHRAEDAERSLDALVRRRFGRRVAARLVNPICRGVYSRPACELTLAGVLSDTWRRYAVGESLTAAVATAAHSRPAGSAVATVRGGLWRLAEELARVAVHSGATLRTNAPVVSIQPNDDASWLVEVGGTDACLFRADRVLMTGGPELLSTLLDGTTLEVLAHSLAPTPAISICTVSVQHSGLDAAPLGTGALITTGAITLAKAVTHLSAKWRWLQDALPEGRHFLRLASATEHVDWMHSPLQVAAEIRRLTGVDVSSSDVRAIEVTRWPPSNSTAIATEDHAWAELTQALAARGVFLAGAWVAGTGLASVIPQARAVARELHSSRHYHISTERTAR